MHFGDLRETMHQRVSLVFQHYNLAAFRRTILVHNWLN